MADLLDVAIFDLPTTPVQWLGLGVTLIGIFVAGMRRRQAVAASSVS